MPASTLLRVAVLHAVPWSLATCRLQVALEWLHRQGCDFPVRIVGVKKVSELYFFFFFALAFGAKSPFWSRFSVREEMSDCVCRCGPRGAQNSFLPQKKLLQRLVREKGQRYTAGRELRRDDEKRLDGRQKMVRKRKNEKGSEQLCSEDIKSNEMSQSKAAANSCEVLSQLRRREKTGDEMR